MAKLPASRKKSRSASARAKTTRQAAAGKRKRKRSAQVRSATIGQAASKVVKSGARLVQHTGQRMITAGARAAKDKLEGALQILQSAAARVQKIAAK
jgi:hypothetical protein